MRASSAAVAAVAAAVLAFGASSANGAVYVKGYGGFKQAPARLALWVSDGFVDLRWTSWGNATTAATGFVTTHGPETNWEWVRVPARVELSGVDWCAGRKVYMTIRYRAEGRRWRRSHADGESCQLSP